MSVLENLYNRNLMDRFVIDEAHCVSSVSKLLLHAPYHNDPKFSDRLVWANSADPDQTAPRGAV